MDNATIAYLSAALVGGLSTGLALGLFFGYLCVREFMRLNSDLTNKIFMMRKQGFVPQFDIEQRSTVDPTHGIIED